MSRAKTLDLDTLLESKNPIYVRNNSLRAQLMIVLEIKDRHGKGRTLKIPPTDVPINLTSSFSRDTLRDSEHLRLALSRGNIKLVDATEAEEYLRTNEAHLEMTTFQMSAYADASSNATNDSMARLSKRGRSTKKEKDVAKELEVLAKKADASSEVNLRVQTTVGSFLSGEKSSKDTLAAILRMKTALSQPDLSYIMQNCSKDENITKFCMNTLAEMAATPEAPFEEA